MRTVHLVRRGVAMAGGCALLAAVLTGCGTEAEDGAPGGDDDGATTTVLGEYRATNGAPWVEKHGLTRSQLNTEHNAWVKAGYRITYINGYALNGADTYAAIWEKSSGPQWTFSSFMTQTQYETAISNNKTAGYFQVMVSAYTVNNVNYFAAIWEKLSLPAGSIVEMHALSTSALKTALSNHASGWRVIHISGYGGTSGDQFAVLFQKATGATNLVTNYAQTETQFAQTSATQTNLGNHLTMLTEYPSGSIIHVVSTFAPGTAPPMQTPTDMTAGYYQQNLTELRYQAYRPVTVSGFSDTHGNPLYSAIFQNSAMSASDLNQIDVIAELERKNTGAPGLSLAVGKNGHIAFAKAYGQADTSAQVPTTTSSLFRVMSISKAITSAAILTLAERGLLDLDMYVFGQNSLFGVYYSYPNVGCRGGSAPCVEDITVRNLLSHTSGGWSGDLGSNDPAFGGSDGTHWTCRKGQNQACEDQAISWALQNQPLDVKTGTKYGYSNFGYLLLARAIEWQTNDPSYGHWVRENVLIPAGAMDMQLGNNLPAEKWPNEVTYYEFNGGDDPYTANLQAMEGNSGWVATPIDLLRFMGRLDGAPPPADFLLPSTESDMLTNWAFKMSDGSSDGGYGLGWYLSYNDPINGESNPACGSDRTQPACVQGGAGWLSGTAANMGDTRAGTSWAIIANAQVAATDTTIQNVLNTVTTWPTFDVSPPDAVIYDPATPGGTKSQCSAGGITMHCCPTGYVMIGVDPTNDVYKCAPVWTTGALTVDKDPGTQRFGMHACPSGKVMVGVSVALNDIICMQLPSGAITDERVDYGTQDAYPMHVCDTIPTSAMSGIRVDKKQLLCANGPQLVN